MAKYTEIHQTFKARKMLEFWGKMIGNINEGCRGSDDLFGPIEPFTSRERLATYILAAYRPADLKRLQSGRAGSALNLVSDDPSETLCKLWRVEGLRTTCKALIKALVRAALRDLPPSDKVDMLEARFGELQKAFKLTDLEREIMILAYIADSTRFEFPLRRPDNQLKVKFYAMALDRSYEEVVAALTQDGNLRRFDILDDDWDFRIGDFGPFLWGAANALGHNFYAPMDVSDALPWDYYGDVVKKHGRLVRAMLTNPPKEGRDKRLNILLYGEPGTGKTSFAKTLAKELGMEAYEVLQGSSDGTNKNVKTRMVGIQLCNDGRHAEKALMVIDEADNLLSLFRADKCVTNTILDTMRMPAIWISNTPARFMDPSVRRRFDYSICYEELNDVQRESIWRNAIEKFDLGDLVDAADVPSLARRYRVSAGGVSLVLRNLRSIAPGKRDVGEVIDLLMQQHCELMEVEGVKVDPEMMPAKDYTLEGLNIKGSVKLDRIVASVKRFVRESEGEASDAVDRPRMNVLLWGPPGSGKTEFVKHLGAETGRSVFVRKGSDLLGMYVGQTEKNIREAFREAKEKKAILFLDEIDGLLQDRSRASRNWEVSQVNELLQQMESFGGILVMATNFEQNLDRAVIRRFTFKLEFDYLDDAGKKRFFETMFRSKLSRKDEAALRAIDHLCPGDYRTVRQSLYYLGDETTNADRLEALRGESAAKRLATTSAPIGF